jgi:hypothetical protein
LQQLAVSRVGNHGDGGAHGCGASPKLTTVCRGLPWFAVVCRGLPWFAVVCHETTPTHDNL